jgi:hypothetical protein
MHVTESDGQSTTTRLRSYTKPVDAPQEPTESRRWKDRLVRAIRIKVIRATTQTGGAVRLCACRIPCTYRVATGQ